MKIGVLLSAYDSEKYIEQVLEPWISMKENSEHDIVIAASNGQWLKFKEAGVEPTIDQTGQILLDSKVDFMYRIVGDNVVSEEESRTILLRYLQYHKCDLIWVLDGDEEYTILEIERIIDYVTHNSETECFRINFKNYTLRLPLFLKDFVRATIYRDNIRGGLSEFFFDTDASYHDGSVPDTLNTTIIPRYVAFPKHYTWLKENKRTFEKIVHQEHKYIWGGPKGARCAYKIDNDEIKFNEKFWNQRGLQIPVLKEEGEIYNHSFDLEYNRLENRIDISNVSTPGEYRFEIFDMTNGDKLYESQINMAFHWSYWVMPSVDRNFNDEEDFKGFRIDVYRNDFFYHQEFLHLRV